MHLDRAVRIPAYLDRITVLQPFLGARAPVHGHPNICATQGAPGVPSSMVLEYIHSVSVVPSILVLTVSEPFLEPFLGILT